MSRGPRPVTSLGGLVIKVEADHDAPFTVMFEPTGMTYLLAGGQSMTAMVEDATPDNEVRIVNWVGGVSIWPPGNVVTCPASSATDSERVSMGAKTALLAFTDGDLRPALLGASRCDVVEEALRALFGFIIEGYPRPDDVDAEAVHLHGFRVTDPSGDEQAAREAAYELARQSMGPPRIFRMGPDGALHEVGLGEL